jgi:MFS transporter, NNP family, nitrate/nitrite transporter
VPRKEAAEPAAETVDTGSGKACPTPRPFSAAAGSVILVTVLFFLTFLGRFIFSPLAPTINHDVPITPSQLGSAFFLGAIGLLIGSIGAGFLASRLNHRGNLLIACFGFCATLVLSRFISSVWGIRAVLLVLGLFAGINQPSVVATITAVVRREDWGKALSVQQVAPPLSLVLAPLVGVALLTWFSWRTTLMWVGIFAGAVGLAFVALGRFSAFQGEKPVPAMVGPVVRQRSFWIMVFLFALGMGAQVGIYTMLPLYLTAERDFPVTTANTLLGLSNISPLAMAFFSGWVTDRIGERRTITLFLVLTGVVTILLGTLTGGALKVMVFLLPAFAVCFFPPAFSALSRIVQPNLRSLAAALGPPLAFILGGGLLPTGLGYMGQKYSFALGIIITGAVIVVGSFAAFGLRLLKELEEGC